MSPAPLSIEQSPMGRVYIPEETPREAALFYTTRDFDGYLNDRAVDLIRRFIRDRFGIDATLFTCHQVHGTEVCLVPSGAPAALGRRARAPAAPHIEFEMCDALWSPEKGSALGIKVADCLPVTLIDAGNSVVANVHAGWRGSAKRITARTVERLQSESSFDPESARAFLGPTIRGCCFEVGTEVITEFESAYGDIHRYIDRTRGDRPYFDVAGVTRQALQDLGLRPDSILDSGLCTRCEGSLFHSYRRDRARSGRNLAIVAQ